MIGYKKVLDALLQAGLIIGFKTRRTSIGETDISVEGAIHIDNETYGKKSMLYITALKDPNIEDPDEELAYRMGIAKEAEKVLNEIGVASVNWDWCGKDSPSFELQVSYFKGYRFWE